MKTEQWSYVRAVQNNGPNYFVIGPRGWKAPVRAHAFREEDAALIAAAPDLLEACRYLMVMVESYSEGAQSENCVDRARAAIAKATGK